MIRHNLWLGVAIGWLIGNGAVHAQPDLPTSPPLLPPPSVVPALLPAAGPAEPYAPPKPDSVPAPLIESIKVENPPTPAVKDDECGFYIGTDGMEYLLWWLKSGPV